VASGSAITGTFNLTFGGVGNVTVADPIATSTGTLTKDGSGTLTLSGTNTYTGATTVSSGTLQISGNGNVGNTSS
jgi:autotransporter-associated beta strand protein